MISLQKHIAKTVTALVGDKIIVGMPEIQVRADTKKDWDYSSPSATSIFNQFKSKEEFKIANIK